MPFKDPVKKAEYMKQYYLDNLEKKKAFDKEYYLKNKEKIIANSKIYNNTLFGKKSNITSKWRQRGLITEDIDKLYEYYLSIEECENCGIELNQKGDFNTKKCMDHCHQTGQFRNILCNLCNITRR